MPAFADRVRRSRAVLVVSRSRTRPLQTQGCGLFVLFILDTSTTTKSAYSFPKRHSEGASTKSPRTDGRPFSSYVL